MWWVGRVGAPPVSMYFVVKVGVCRNGNSMHGCATLQTLAPSTLRVFIFFLVLVFYFCVLIVVWFLRLVLWSHGNRGCCGSSSSQMLQMNGMNQFTGRTANVHSFIFGHSPPIPPFRRKFECIPFGIFLQFVSIRPNA